MCKRSRSLLVPVLMLVVACDDATGPGDRNHVAVNFAISSEVASTTSSSLTVSGSNGTLVIDRLWLVVDELELEGPDGGCPALDDDECEFETGPFLLKVPLNGTAVSIGTDDVPAGTYTRVEFEVDDVELDDDDDGDDETRRTEALWTRIRADAPDWPRNASMLVAGTFTAVGGSPQAFRTFFDAEIEIELPLVPPLVKTDGAGGTVTVELNPARWFRRGDGTVWNLAQSNFATTGRLLEFELEIEHGFDRARVELSR